MLKQKQKIVFLLISLLLPGVVFAEMSSSSYTISSDVIGSFGQDSTSSSYILNDTGGEVGTGIGSSSSYNLGAGFWQTAIDYSVAISCPADLVINEIIGTGKSNLSGNSVSCNVITDNPTGYQLNLSAETAEMTSGSDVIAAYTPIEAGTPEEWSVGVAASEWGVHLGSGSTTADTATWGTADTYDGGKWLNVPTAGVTLIERSNETTLSGDDEVIWFGSEIGSSKLQPTGTYTVNITVTAITL